MHFVKIVLLVVFILCLTGKIYSEDPPPIEWGKIPITDLEMKTFPKDTNASAVILCDYGESRFNNDLNVVFKRHTRIKILTSKGYEWGTHSISLYTEDLQETINDIEAVTYCLNDKGEIEKKEMDDDDIFEEEINDSHARYKFTLPGLQPGCIIEYRYKITAQSPFYIRDWVFQFTEPVRWSEYRICTPPNFAFSVIRLGYEPLSINEVTEVNQTFSGYAQAHLNGSMIKCNLMRFAIQDAPALRDEPFTSSIKDYRNEVQVQLSEYNFSGTGRQKVLNDWPTLIKELLGNESFYEMIDDTRKVTKLTEEITSGCKTDEDKIRKIYNWVSQSIVWSGEDRVFGKQEVNDVLETKKGNNAEITFLLLSMFKSIGINGDPIILSTRSNGKIQDLYPMTSQFNYVLARVKIGDLNLFLDATDPQRPIELVPLKVINSRGLVIKEGDKPEWINISTGKRELKKSLTLLNIKENGSITALFDDYYFDYAGILLRKQIKDKKDDEIAKDIFESDEYGYIIDSIKVLDADSINKPLNIKCWVSSENYANTNSDIIYINPYLIHRVTKNPLTAEIRNFPIDFGLLTSSKNIINITIPNDYEVKEKINDRSHSLSSSISFNRKVMVEENKIIISNNYDVNEYIIKSNNYPRLRYFFSQMVAAESEQLVLQKKANSIAPGTTDLQSQKGE